VEVKPSVISFTLEDGFLLVEIYRRFRGAYCLEHHGDHVHGRRRENLKSQFRICYALLAGGVRLV
jgi:hypothetical protein